jgi:hypothetical protein
MKTIKLFLKVCLSIGKALLFRVRLTTRSTIKKGETYWILMPEPGVRLYQEGLLKLLLDLTNSSASVRLFFDGTVALQPGHVTALGRLLDLISREVEVLFFKIALGSRVSLVRVEGLTSNDEAKALDDIFISDESLREIAMYDTAIFFRRKSSDATTDLDHEEKTFLKATTASCRSIIRAMNNYSNEKPCYVFALDEYARSAVFRRAGAQLGAKPYRFDFLYHLNASSDCLSLDSAIQSNISRLMKLKAWPNYKDLALTSGMVENIYADLHFRMLGTGGHIFSKNIGGLGPILRDRVMQSSSAKRLVSVFLSSEDENVAFEHLSKGLDAGLVTSDAFSSQLEMVEWLVAQKWENMECALLIRFHPRLFVTKSRDSKAEYQQYVASIMQRNSNVYIDHPDSEYSVYDIALASDVCIVSWSSIGLELAKMGVPVVTPLQRAWCVTPNLNLFRSVQTRDEILSIIDQSIHHEVSLEDLAAVTRWHYLLYLSSMVSTENSQLSKLSFIKDFRELMQEDNWLELVYERLARVDCDDRNETDALIREVEKLVALVSDKTGPNVEHLPFYSRLSELL